MTHPDSSLETLLAVLLVGDVLIDRLALEPIRQPLQIFKNRIQRPPWSPSLSVNHSSTSVPVVT